ARGKRAGQEVVRSRLVVSAPIRGGLDLLFELAEVRAEALSSTGDVRLYFVGCLIHSRFSLSDSIVRSGTGTTRLILRRPAAITMAPGIAVTRAITNVAAHMAMTVESA